MALLAISIASGPRSSPTEAFAVVGKIEAGLAQDLVPDSPEVRAALTIWGVEYDATPVKVAGMLRYTHYLQVNLPPGWAVKEGGNGHFYLRDETQYGRVRWHVHPWDPISVTVQDRRTQRTMAVDSRTASVQVLDRGVVVYALPVRYPFDRIMRLNWRGEPGYDRLPDREQDRACVQAEQAVEREAQLWLQGQAQGRSLYGVDSWTW
jgi:hypothetical protein